MSKVTMFVKSALVDIASYSPSRETARRNRDLFVGAMPSQYLARLVVNGDRITAEEKLLTDLKQRIRDVRQAPDGSIYVLAGNSLLRLKR